MKAYLVYVEYPDNWVDKQAIFDTKEKAVAFNKERNGGTGCISVFELNVPGIIYGEI